MLAFGARSCYNAGMKLTDVHTHSTFSADGITPLADMLARAEELGVAYYGVSEHFDYDYLADGVLVEGKTVPMTDAAAYFACARALQADALLQIFSVDDALRRARDARDRPESAAGDEVPAHAGNHHQRRKQRQQHIQHQAAGIVIRLDMG